MNLYIFTQRDPIFVDQFLLNINYEKFENVKLYNAPNFGNSKISALRKFYNLFGIKITIISILKLIFNFNKLPSKLTVINDTFSNLQKSISTEVIQDCDILLSVSAPHKIDEKILNRFKKKINFHCGKLPKYAGMMPVFWQFYNNEIDYYISMHELDEKIDSGNLLYEEKHVIRKDLFNTMVDCKLQSAIIFNTYASGNLCCSRREIEKTNDWNKYPTKQQIANFRNMQR